VQWKQETPWLRSPGSRTTASDSRPR
jgi:hypothetical protein